MARTIMNCFDEPLGCVDKILNGAKSRDLPCAAASAIATCDQAQDREGVRPSKCQRSCSHSTRGYRIALANGWFWPVATHIVLQPNVGFWGESGNG